MMTDIATGAAPAETPAAPAPAAPAPSPAPAPADNRERPAVERSPSLQVREAARALVARRRELREQQAAAAPPAAPLPVEQSPPEAGDAAQPIEAAPGEAPSASPAEDKPLPPIEPPRAWKSEYKAAFEALPRNVQEQIAESEKARETDFRQRQHEVAERQKAFEIELSQMHQMRQQYEQGLNSALQMTLSGNEFADIRTMEDIEALARDDWPRWVRYQTHQQKVGMLQQQLQEVQQQNYNEQMGHWARFAQEQDQRFSEAHPDAKALKDAAVNYLKDVGFSQQEISRNWNGSVWRDARMQGVILDAVRYRDAKAKADAAVKKPVPEVVKPGVAAPRLNPFAAEIKELEAKGSLSLREATKLTQLRSKAAKQ